MKILDSTVRGATPNIQPKGNTMLKEGNLVRIKEDGDQIMRVYEDETVGDMYVKCEATTEEDGVTSKYMYENDELELVAVNQKILDRMENPQPMEEQTVAIVSFEGAVKREVLAVREAMKCCDSISYFRLVINASGRVNDGEVEISYHISESSYGSDGVEGNNVKECLSEFLRRHGWNSINKPIAISYDGIPT